MVALAIDTGRWQDTVMQLLPRELKNVFTAGSQRELLKQVGAAILVFDDRVIDLNSGRETRLDSEELDADALAEAVSELLGGSATETTVVLLLPPDEFAATSVAMPGMNRDALVSALKLQANNLLPSYSGALAVVANPHGADDPHADWALWIPERRLDRLYQAFSGKGLFLAGVLPRCLALAEVAGEQEILEEDSQHMTSVSLRNGVIVRWLHISKRDLQQEMFERQWRQALAAVGPDTRVSVNAVNAPDIYQQTDADHPGIADYYFFPHGALQARRQMEKGKRVMLGVAAVAVLAFLASLPFLFQVFETARLQANLRSQRELSSAARADRQVVQNFEEQWGVITDFPRQDLVQILFTLQSVLSPEQLTSLELSEGVIRIEGESAEPQAILQRLESHPMFTEVTFSRATNNSRYYIDLRLSTVNFEGYLVRYFPDN